MARGDLFSTLAGLCAICLSLLLFRHAATGQRPETTEEWFWLVLAVVFDLGFFAYYVGKDRIVRVLEGLYERTK